MEPNITSRFSADDVGRAKKFYQSLPGWKMNRKRPLADKSLEWQNIITGEPQESMMNSGGITIG